ncbi:MAG: FMN-binding glutamate synthase family protein [Bacillota bacterium]
MSEFMTLFSAAATGFLAAGILFLLFWKPLINFYVDAFIKRLLKDPYPENIGEMYNVFAKVGVQNILETDLRGTTGEPLQRPFGTPRRYSPWDQILFNPVYLTRKPVLEAIDIDTKVTLGPAAKRPLTIRTPIMIAGMAYGFALSYRAKIALAKAADQAGTATNTGVGPFLADERKCAKHLIIQYHRGNWGKEPEALRQADMIEINLGYGALGSAPRTARWRDLSPEFRAYMHLKPGQNLTEEATLPDVQNGAELKELVDRLRMLTNGVPIGIKFGATQNLERELEVFTGAGIDFLSVAGSESGINYGPAILADDTGLPTLPALCRTVRFLESRGLKGKISVIISGGLYTPGHFLKSLILGADAVAVGTIAVLALAHAQLAKVIPLEPPTELVYDNGKSRNLFDIEKGAKSVENFLKSSGDEIILALRTLGKTSLKNAAKSDLCALTPETARMAGIELALFGPAESKTGGHG